MNWDAFKERCEAVCGVVVGGVIAIFLLIAIPVLLWGAISPRLPASWENGVNDLFLSRSEKLNKSKEQTKISESLRIEAESELDLAYRNRLGAEAIAGYEDQLIYSEELGRRAKELKLKAGK